MRSKGEISTAERRGKMVCIPQIFKSAGESQSQPESTHRWVRSFCALRCFVLRCQVPKQLAKDDAVERSIFNLC